MHARSRGGSSSCRALQPCSRASSLSSQWAAGGLIRSFRQRSVGFSSFSSLHKEAQLSCQLFASGSHAWPCSDAIAPMMSAMGTSMTWKVHGAKEAHRPLHDDPVIIRRVKLCVSLCNVCENGVKVYSDSIFDSSDPFVCYDKAISHLDTCGREHLSPPDPFAICWLALTVAGA